MRKLTRRTAYSGLAIAAVGILLAGCAAAPEDDDTDNGAAEPTSDFLPCMVSDAGGFDDRSFNQLGKAGLDKASDELGVTPNAIESADESAYGPNVDNLVAEGCNLIVTVGFLLADATLEGAEANPDVNFAIIDDQLDTDFDGTPDVENGKPIVFDTAQAAFLAGYAAASYSTSGIVGTFGGIQIPPVTIFMDGFALGVEHYNEVNSADVTVLGWDVAAQTGSFTGGFAAGTEAKQAAQTLIDQGADVILPVGGPIYQSAAEAIRDADRGIALIGVDADVYETDDSVADLLLTSIMKGVDVGVYEVVMAAANDEFDNTPFVGTLENDGVGLAPFHDFEDLVSPELQAELDAIRDDIISGAITVESEASPK